MARGKKGISDDDKSGAWNALVSSRRALVAARKRRRRAEELRKEIEELQERNHFSMRLRNAYAGRYDHKEEDPE